MDFEDIPPLDLYAVRDALFAHGVLDRNIDLARCERETSIDDGTPFDLLASAHRLAAMAHACELAATILMSRYAVAPKRPRIAA